MNELQNLKRLHEAQDTILSLRCKIAGLKGKCMSIIKWHELYEPEEVKLAKELKDELDEILSTDRLKELLS